MQVACCRVWVLGFEGQEGREGASIPAGHQSTAKRTTKTWQTEALVAAERAAEDLARASPTGNKGSERGVNGRLVSDWTWQRKQRRGDWVNPTSICSGPFTFLTKRISIRSTLTWLGRIWKSLNRRNEEVTSRWRDKIYRCLYYYSFYISYWHNLFS